MKNTVYWIWLSQALGAGSTAAVRLVRHFGDAAAVFRAGPKEFSGDCPVKDNRVLQKLSSKSLTEAERILRWCERSGINIICPDMEEYPKSLIQLRDAPMVLYVAGRLPRFNDHLAVAVVGTRKMSDYGRSIAYEMGRGLAAGGAILVSGMALGIDGMAMAGALDMNGVAVGVLGSGIDIVYPKEHKDLMRRTLDRGAIITEYPPGTPPSARHFPVRNRLISGLCQATVVVEGDGNSGSLITARQAVYQGRDLYAVPGRIGDEGAEGTNRLIKEGASAVTEAVDVLQNYEFIYPETLSITAAMTARAYAPNSYEAAATVARRSEKRSGSSKDYYGKGLYGGKQDESVKSDEHPANISAEKKADAKKRSTSKKTKNEKRSPFSEQKTASKHIDLDMLGEDELRVYAAMKPDVPTLPDELSKQGSIPVGAVMSALTILELSGAIESGAGGYYMRSSADVDLIPMIQSEE